jgi:hypothetical protein
MIEARLAQQGYLESWTQTDTDCDFFSHARTEPGLTGLPPPL